ncbi:OsmC family peroxiredoxin [Pedobacter sp. HMF7647]|uniref:OsmC family peroxiredoxin n=1 Tax=Hufsiella arboris TaxID=2695275 RepID=A0A7K1Y7K0_9SPHI|nr:OsmC family protein [Hufsiella arboris]MXV50552.1 OsmC family peroxiredoxin [Hufsiella arboris]
MKISATIKNGYEENDITVTTEGNSKKISIPTKIGGLGSSINGGELLFLSLATCFCNDFYREASRRQIEVEAVEVTVSGEFNKEGESGSNINYDVNIQSPNHSREEINEIIRYVDEIAEIHNTLRKGVSVTLKN